MDSFKALDEIKKSKGYEIALLTTFNFDVGFFERSVVFPLYDNGTRDITVFVDSKELNKAISSIKTCKIGEKYMAHPIEINGAFHPKLILLLGQSSAKLFIASANLTQTGFSYNNEIFNSFIYDAAHPENLNIINSAIDFFLDLQKLSQINYDDISNKVSSLLYYKKSSKNDELFLIHNLKQPILKQIKGKISNVDKISIAVPYYDNELSALNGIHSAFPEADISLYIQDKKSKFPVKKEHKKITDIRVFNQIDTNNHFYHGKVFLFKSKEKSCVAYGSANCTQSALIKTKNSGGNIECDVIEYGAPNEFDEFFKHFKICSKAEPDCDIIESKREDNNNFFFIYGIVVGEKLDLFFGYKKKENATVKIGDNNLNCQYEGNLFKASLMLDAFYPNNPFEIEVLYGNIVETLAAWDINPLVLDENRRKEAADYLDNYENEAKSTDKYLSDQIAILKSMALSWEEYERENEVFDIVEQRSSDTPEDDEESEGIIDYVIPAADIRTAYNKYLKVNKIKASFISWYFKKFITGAESSTHSSAKEETEKRKPRKPTNDEIKFRRFVSRRLNELFNSDIEKYVSFENYLQITLVFISILEKYTIIENVEGLFDTQFVADSELGLISRLLTMEIPDDKELSENVILLTLQAIINIHKAGLSDYRYELKSKNLLSDLDWLFDIRIKYKAYLNYISNKMDNYGLSFNTENYISYFEQLFGYLPFNSLKKLIKEMYGQDTKIEIKDGLLLIETSSSNLSNHMVMSKKVMDEIKHYVYHYENPTRFILIIHNTNVKFVRNGDPAVSVEYYVDFESGSFYQAINRMSGKREEQKDFALR